MITKDMIERAKASVDCVHNFAHHEWIDCQAFTVTRDWGEGDVELTYYLCMCECGATEVMRPNHLGGMEPLDA
jgi:hypothetical protein